MSDFAARVQDTLQPLADAGRAKAMAAYMNLETSVDRLSIPEPIVAFR
ncbi:MAG: hypothetical protein Q8N89_04780 [Azonexus sp.]|nr:hypothetical protein [Azonexus sp.]